MNTKRFVLGLWMSRAVCGAVCTLGVLGGSVGLLVGNPALAAAATEDGPKATLQRLNGACEKLLRAKTEPGSAEESRTKQEIKKHASALLDYTELCKRALLEHWEKMGEAKRTEFVATLRELIERNYVRQLRTNLEYTVSYNDEQVTGNEAKVATNLRLMTKGKATQVQIDYRMLKQPDGSWKVYDVITDELSLVRNYRTQFTRIIGANNYDGLLSRMKAKVSEEQKDGVGQDTGKGAGSAAGSPTKEAEKPGGEKTQGAAAGRAQKTPPLRDATTVPAGKKPAGTNTKS